MYMGKGGMYDEISHEMKRVMVNGQMKEEKVFVGGEPHLLNKMID
jgi:hypothetical protein